MKSKGVLQMNENTNRAEANEEQLLYAKILRAGMLVGLLILLATFFLYATGIIAPAIPHDMLAKYWSMDVHHYMETVEENHLGLGHLVTGWAWTGLLGKGDYLNFVGIVILSAITIFCYLAIIPTLLRKGDRVYAIVAVLEVIILSLAASGILTAGH
jgi:hypothetical protein